MNKFWILLLPTMFTVVRLPGIAFSAIVALWVGFATSAAAGYDEGAAAFIRGDYEEAWREWLELGERGHQSAQYNLGVLYSIGLGVDQDDVEASKWFRRAADRGLPAAQMRLGNAYVEGKGVTEDLKEAYFWFTLAATHFSLGEQHEQAVAARESTGAGLTRTQITEVLDRAMSWKPLPQSVGESEKERLIVEPNGESALHLEGSGSNGLGSGSPSLSEKESDIAETESEASGTEASQGVAEAQAADPGPGEAQVAEVTGTPSGSSGESSGIGAPETGTLEASAAELSAVGTGAEETGGAEPAPTQPATAQNVSAAARETTASGSEQAAESAAADVTIELATTTSGADAQETSDSPDRPAGPSFAAHLSSVRSEEGTERAWRNLQGQYPALLDGRELAVTTIEVAEQGTFYRVMAGTFDTFDEAQALCSQLEASEQYCVVRRLSGGPSQ